MPDDLSGLPCPPIVTHNDGTMVSASNPAQPGEQVVAYAVGLGQTSPPSVTGEVVTTAAATVTTFALDFNYRRNALPTKPPPVTDAGVSQPIYTGTATGSVGVYQIVFEVPPVPPGTPACAQSGLSRPTENVVYSNLTFSVGGRYSFDGAGICVAVDETATSGPTAGTNTTKGKK